ncbi:unnamed protein product [Brassica rapa]|uniref:MATH domain-containing protein n=1 Tax=Brassica campestris TaxID=3711 RepID=A0A8D9HNM6_BRACM|nr:unnamed protein product [Brassica rapa]
MASSSLDEIGETEHYFDGKSTTYGFSAMLPLFKLEENDGGCLVNEQVMIVAELDVFEVIGTFDDNAAESNDSLKKTSPVNNANGTKQVESSVKKNPPKKKKRWLRTREEIIGTSLSPLETLFTNFVIQFDSLSSSMSMGEQVEKRFTWVLKNFSDLQDEPSYSRPFVFAGCNWHIIAYPKGYDKCRHLSLYLGIVNPESLPSGWRRELKFRLTLVNKVWSCDTKVLEGQRWFDASSSVWGFKEFMPLSTIRYRDNKFLVGDKIVIVAELHLFPLVVETVKIIQPLSCNEGSQVAAGKSQNAASSQEKVVDFDVSQDVDASKEGVDDDDGASQEGSDDDDASEEGSGDDDDDDASALVSEDGSSEKGSLKDGALTVGNCGVKRNNVASETEVSNVDYDDAPIEDPGDDDVIENDQGDDNASSLASGVSERDVGSLNKFDDASQREDDGDMKCNKVASVTEASNDLPEEVQPVEETKDVNGFQVLSSQVESVSHIFRRHPDIALGFRPKNQAIRKAYMNELLSLIEMMCQSPHKLSEDDLSNADDTLADLIDVGFKLDWLKIKLNEVSEKKKKEKGSDARLRTMEEQLLKLKLMFLDLETQLQKEKEEALAARAPFSFNDVVY